MIMSQEKREDLKEISIEELKTALEKARTDLKNFKKGFVSGAAATATRLRLETQVKDLEAALDAKNNPSTSVMSGP